MLLRSGIVLIKYWFSVSDDEQERRFQARLEDTAKHWKLSPMDLESRSKWVDYSRAKDAMFSRTDTDVALVGGRGRRQEARPAELHLPPALERRLRVRGSRAPLAAKEAEGHGLRPAAAVDAAVVPARF